jgi:NADH-quinone oxidoreductase subunit N
MVSLNLVELKNFNIFPEYFIGISSLYILIVIVLVSYNVFGILIQKTLSDSIGLILLLACYIILNDDLIFSVNNLGLYYSISFSKTLITDYFAFVTKFSICFFASLYFFLISDFLKHYKLTYFEYLLILLFTIIGLLILCSSNDLLTAYLSIELISLSSYVLAAFKKHSVYSTEAGIKYLITGAISSAFFLLGSSFIYGSSGSLNLTDINFILFQDLWFDAEKGLNIINPLLEIGIFFVFFSLLIKLAIAPFHLWSLDVYEYSPTISTFFFAIITKLSFFVFLVRISSIFMMNDNIFQFFGLLTGLISVFIGSFGGLRQRKIKTLLAYSSISHMGYALLAFATGTRFGFEMLVFYLIMYIISGLSIWFIIIATRKKKNCYNTKLNKEIGDLGLLSESNPSMANSFALNLFSIAGIPPLVGFFTKIGVLVVIINSKLYFIALLAILCSVVSTFYYIRLVKILYYEKSLVGNLYHPLLTSKTIIFSITTFSIVFFFINPTLLYLLIYKMSLYSFLI